jgi:hypothetical protein
MIDNFESKAAVTIAEMARSVKLSRQRFTQLIGSAFPHPIYNIATRRPYYTEELQRVCIEVRRRHFGVNGKPVLFYAKGHRTTKPARPPKSSPIATPQYPEILAAVHALGLAATSDQVTAAVHAVFPAGVDGIDQGRLIRSVFVHLKRQNAGDKVR